jgi:hypothetical protein
LILVAAPGGSECSAGRLYRFTPGQKAPGNLVGCGCLSYSVFFTDKCLCPVGRVNIYRLSNPDSPSVSLQLIVFLSVSHSDRQPSLVRLIDQIHMENLEYFNCLGSKKISDTRCRREIKSGLVPARTGFKKKKKKKKKKKERKKKETKKKTLFTVKLDLNLRKKPVQCYIWSTAFYDAETLTLRKVGQK